ncbi:sigma-70 family RNA polymerase sigma factor [Streptomyces griseoincarnatus]|uniref:Sigma-70 family RNA polymerase sigma factor n=3 Tax=Streptomyces TaxID=1883 RepID=A0ABN3X6G2_9ACTN|nr:MULTISPECIES: sigma-70 family RNA polymerase sigma factor [Streptomyces]MQL66454.1 sigma-70 family RNA polymerase sigma factor [Streptomyces vinaceus]WPW21041.1 sigma-70 family RNA polymerase sigma factor [Streptomyces griseoincarnatus]MDH3039179.1 sigma-70 family RNA polymerase sigma factor [Streptomyces sp. TRM75561]GGP77848.1 DNA-directed RNA polymerase sigma-70 factor [Streptomyces griseoincarnatus]GGT81935.1 DNA-directed RNA polymerase sigma-70 factor [Streptomyces variabilis]
MTNGTATTDLDATLERYRVELTGYCYRMLGSSFEAEDAVQDTMIRAWRSLDKFEGRSSLRSWLYRIATNVCLDMLSAGNKRARPMDLTESTPLAQAALSPRPDHTWLEPMPDDRVLPTPADPAEAAVAKESVRLAFMAALQRLPAKQRAVLILREVLAWKASEVAELLDTSVASVNSALQRARATLAERREPGADASVSDPLDEDQKKLLDRYVAAFEGYDMSALTALLHEDAVMTMPPFDLWLTGADDITGFMTTLGAACAHSKLVPVEVNGLPGFAQYKPDPDNGGYTPWAVQALEISDGRITGFHCFLDTQRWFPLFGLPLRLEAETDEVEQGAQRG